MQISEFVVPFVGFIIFISLVYAMYRVGQSGAVDLRFKKTIEHDEFSAPHAPAGSSGQHTLEPPVSDKGNKESSNIVETYVSGAIKLLPYEVLAIYPALKTTASSFSEDHRNTIAALLTLFCVGFLRSKAVRKELRPEKTPFFASIAICICWIYSVSGYIIWPPSDIGLSAAQVESIATLLLFVIGFVVTWTQSSD